MSTISLQMIGVRTLERRIGATQRAVAAGIARAVNRTAVTARKEGVKRIRGQVRLKARYVQKHLRVVQRATARRPEAIVRGSLRATLLSRYAVGLRTRPVKPSYRHRSKGRKGMADAWSRFRDIPPGRKIAGVYVRVKAVGTRRLLKRGFFLRLKAGRHRAAGAVGVAVRTGKGRNAYRVLHGPSVNQVWDDVRIEVMRDLGPVLRRRLAHEVRYRLDRLQGLRVA